MDVAAKASYYVYSRSGQQTQWRNSAYYLGTGLSHRLFGITFHQILNIAKQHSVQSLLGVKNWIDHTGLDITAQVVYVAMFCFVGTHGTHQIKDCALFTQLPVGAADGRCSLCAPFSEFRSFGSLFDGLDNFCVGRARYQDTNVVS
eukprot:scaffold8717_cov167-Amphora_coffeaeformis.AAC.1